MSKALRGARFVVPGTSCNCCLCCNCEDGPTLRPPTPGQCDIDEAVCTNGACIPRDYVCDADYDCTDRSDEADCSKHSISVVSCFESDDAHSITRSLICVR